MKLAQANVLELAPVLSRTATLTGSAVDTRALSGVADVTGATFAEVTNADTTQMIAVNADALKRYVKVVGTLGGTSTPTFAYGVALVGINHAGRNASQAV
jgi:hypothetical protein